MTERVIKRPAPKDELERKLRSLLKDESLFMKRVLYKGLREPDTSLPEILDISLEEFVEAYPDWIYWRALDKRYPPATIRKQPRRLLNAFIYLDSIFERMAEEKSRKERLEQEAANG